jgi:hypothetical protein
LSAADAALLYAWVCDRRSELVELHTDVALGVVSRATAEISDPAMRRQALSCVPLRADALVLVGDVWWCLECKPDAGYVALGQVLTYRFYCNALGGPLLGLSAGVVTNAVQVAVLPVFHSCGVAVFEQVGVLSRS